MTEQRTSIVLHDGEDLPYQHFDNPDEAGAGLRGG